MPNILTDVNVVKNKRVERDSIWISHSRDRHIIKLTANMLRFRDKDTRQIIFYIPSIDISGYGENEDKAMELLNFSVNEYFSYLRGLSQKMLDKELLSFGWEKTKDKKKEFSKSFVDGDGNLRSFNAVAGEVERLTVQAI